MKTLDDPFNSEFTEKSLFYIFENISMDEKLIYIYICFMSLNIFKL